MAFSEGCAIIQQKYWTDAPQEELDPILDACVVRFKDDLTENQQISCKGSMKALFTYTFLAAIMPFNSQGGNAEYIYKFLVTKLQNSKPRIGLKVYLNLSTLTSWLPKKMQI